MKPKKNSRSKIRNLNNNEIEYITKWIDHLTKEELAQFEALSRVKLAEVLLEAYVRSKEAEKRRPNSKPQRGNR
jgi:hypothetical protein